MNEAKYFISCYLSSKTKSGVYISELPQGDEWNSKLRKDTEGGNPK